MLDGIDIESFRTPFNIYFSSWLKNSSMQRWLGGGFLLDLGQKPLKFHLMHIKAEMKSDTEQKMKLG